MLITEHVYYLAYGNIHHLFFFSIRPPPGFLPVLGLLTRYMTSTLDAALLYVVHRDGVTTIVDSVHRASSLYL